MHTIHHVGSMPTWSGQPGITLWIACSCFSTLFIELSMLLITVPKECRRIPTHFLCCCHVLSCQPASPIHLHLARASAFQGVCRGVPCRTPIT